MEAGSRTFRGSYSLDGRGVCGSCSVDAMDVVVEPVEAVRELAMDGAEKPQKPSSKVV